MNNMQKPDLRQGAEYIQLLPMKDGQEYGAPYQQAGQST